MTAPAFPLEDVIALLPSVSEAKELVEALHAHIGGVAPLPDKAAAELCMVVVSAAMLKTWGRIRVVHEPPDDPPLPSAPAV